MARIYTCGYELASTLEFSYYAPAGGNASANQWTTGRVSGSCFLQRGAGIGASPGGHMHYFGQTLNEFYIRFGYLLTGGRATVPSERLFFRNQVPNNVLRIAAVTGSDTTTFYSSNGTLGTANNIMPVTGKWYLWEMHIKLDAVAGFWIVRVDGEEVFNFSGNTNPQGLGAIDTIYFHTGTAGDGQEIRVDDLAVNDPTGSVNNSWPGDGVVQLLLPNANGDSSEWTGSDGNQVDNYLLIDENPSNGDTDYVSAASSGLKDWYHLSNLTAAVPTNATISVVQPVAVARRADAGQVTSLDLGVKSGTTEDYSSSQDLSTVYQLYRGNIYDENPDTDSGWTKDDLNNLQVGVRSA